MKGRVFVALTALFSITACSSGPSAPATLIPDVGEVRLLFDHGVLGESKFYNYCPSIFIEDDVQYVYYCSNQLEGNVTDYIALREGKIVNNKLIYSDIDFVLEHGDPNEGMWDTRHVCDPSVIKGEFLFHGESYNYLMAYLGCIRSDVVWNETGIAVSKTPQGPWIKCDFKQDGVTPINPLVPYTDFTTKECWGTGQPSLFSVDGKGRVILFTSVGSDTATFTNVREYDFSNIDDIKLIREERTLTDDGVRATATGANFISNADFGYDTENRRVIMAKPRRHFGTDGKLPNIVADTIDVYYIDDTEGTGVGDVLFAGNNTTKIWKLIGSIDQSVTGFLRNHNTGLITDPYGHLLDTNTLGVAFTRSDEGPDNFNGALSSYRIYATSLSFPKAYFPK